MILHEYQERTADALYESDAVAAVLPMGAGKTVSSLTALGDLLRAGEIDRAIVWGPKRVAQLVWDGEIAKWGMGLTTLNLVGRTPVQRTKALARRPMPQILIVNYEMADWLKAQGIRADDRTAVVFDELSRLKSAKGRRRKSVMAVCAGAKMRWGLTGTPKGNGPIDLWGQADALRPGCWGSFYQWRARHFRALDRDGHQWAVLPGCDEIIDDAFADLSFMLRPSDIPANPEPVYIDDAVTLPAEARRLYAEFADELTIELEDGTDVFAENASSALMKLRQLSGGHVYDDAGDTHRLHTAKLDALRELIDEAGEPVLVFYQFLAEVDAILEMYPDAKVLGGGTSDAQAVEIVEAWNRGEVPVLLGHPAAMGHGLNLQDGGRRAIWYSLTWSMEEYQQANARLARQGQLQQVYVHHINARGTVDTQVARALRQKEAGQQRLLDIIKEV